MTTATKTNRKISTATILEVRPHPGLLFVSSNQNNSRREWLRRATGSVLGTALASEGESAEPGIVPTKLLGSTGRAVPILLQGCGEIADPNYSTILHAGFREGLYYLDTALAYEDGKSHRAVGVFVDQLSEREKLFITSKVFLPPKAASPERYSKPVRGFLPDLQTDYLDMLLMHGIEDPKVLEPEYIRMGQKLKKDGLAHHFGFSCHEGNVPELLTLAARLGPEAIDAVMFRYSFAEYGDLALNKAIDACKKAGIGLIAMKTQASVPDDKDEVRRFRSENFTLGQAKLKAVWADERIDAAVSMMPNTRILRENIAAAKSQKQLTMAEFHQLNRYAAQTASNRCRGCSHLCESKVDGEFRIADALRYLMYDECYGRTNEARALYRALDLPQFDRVDLVNAERACKRRRTAALRVGEGGFENAAVAKTSVQTRAADGVEVSAA